MSVTFQPKTVKACGLKSLTIVTLNKTPFASNSRAKLSSDKSFKPSTSLIKRPGFGRLYSGNKSFKFFISKHNNFFRCYFKNSHNIQLLLLLMLFLDFIFQFFFHFFFKIMKFMSFIDGMRLLHGFFFFGKITEL